VRTRKELPPIKFDDAGFTDPTCAHVIDKVCELLKKPDEETDCFQVTFRMPKPSILLGAWYELTKRDLQTRGQVHQEVSVRGRE
jgi:hypothetical protein